MVYVLSSVIRQIEYDEANYEITVRFTNGKTYNNTYHFLFVFRDGKICLSKEYNDSAHAAWALGPL